MIQSIKTLNILLILFICQEHAQSFQNQNKIHGAVFPGIESNLILWSFSDPPEIDSLILLRTQSLRDSFHFLIKFPVTPNRYLDTDVSPKNRYFYKLVYHENDGHSWSSELDTPPFGRPLKMNNNQKMILNQFKHENIKNCEELITALVGRQITRSKIFPIGFNIKRLSSLFTLGSQRKFPWLENLPVDDIFKMEPILENKFWKNISEQVTHELEMLNPYFKNIFFMTPQEWDQKVEKGMYLIEDRINVLFSSFKDELALLKEQHPVRVSWIRIDDDRHWIDLTVLNPEHLFEMEITINSDGNSITVPFPDDIIPGSILSVIIPENWYECSMAIDGIPVQKLMIDHSQSEIIAISLRNEFIINSSLENTFIIPEVDEQIRLNELMFDPQSQSLSIELFHETKVIDPVRIIVNSTETWTYTPPLSFEPTIVDSQFYIPIKENGIIWIHLDTGLESSIFQQKKESFPMTTLSKTIWARNPDNLIWEQTSVSTIGLKNHTQKKDNGSKIIPELFALYQNYPNPFNLETSIKFDLLKQSIVSLYVLNAAGHVESIYLDNENLIPGQYSYVWQGNSHSSGVYFVTLLAILEPYAPVVMSRKMIYLK